MFADTHYVPVLRWKRGERGALSDLTPSDRASITPLIEVLPGYMRPRRSEQDDLWVAAVQVIDACGAAPIFLDVSKVVNTPYRGSTDRPVERLYSALGAAGVHAIPTTTLSHPQALQKIVAAVVKIDNRGMALRVPVASLQSADFRETLQQVLAQCEVLPESVDLIVEYGVVGNAPVAFSYVCHRLPLLKRWRTFTILAGSFPTNLMDFKKPGQYEIPREEWKLWLSEIRRLPSLPRRPTFGDYTVQHPIYYEPVDGANPSASIRYTCDTYWIVMRGQGLRNKQGTKHAQYPANAELLCGRKEFAGAHYSPGDEYIWNIGSHKEPGPGTPETWIRAGINHHISLVARQVPASTAMIG